MAVFMDLFDPTLCDEPITDDLEELLSATALLEQPKRPTLPPRSKTTLDLCSNFKASSDGKCHLLDFRGKIAKRRCHSTKTDWP